MNKTVLYSTFDKRFFHLDDDFIDKLKKDDNGMLQNVIVGLEKFYFGLIEESETDYGLVFISTTKRGELKGVLLKNSVKLKLRNELLVLFSKTIKTIFEIPLDREIFNTFQTHTRTHLTKKNYFTIDDSERDKMPKKSTILLKGYKDIIYTPYIETSDKNVRSKKIHKEKISRENYVYVMFNSLTGHYKIGKSFDPKYRERTLQSQEPDVKLIAKWKCEEKVEKELHKIFKEKRVRGEWFLLTEEDISAIMKIMEEKIHTNNELLFFPLESPVSRDSNV